MNSKVAREGFVQDTKSLETSRDKVFTGVAGSVIKTAGVKPAIEKPEIKEGKYKDKMTKKEAESCGFFKSARQCGWGIYSVDSIDGGLGSVWYLEKDAEGIEYLVKQTNSVGDVLRRAKTTVK